jgi:hypothetical protein
MVSLQPTSKEMRQLRENSTRQQLFSESLSSNSNSMILSSQELVEEPMPVDTIVSLPPPEPRDGERYLQYQRGLINLHLTTGIPPTVKILDGEVTKQGDLAIAGGTYSDIWLGVWLSEKKVRITGSQLGSRFEHA